MTISEFPFIFTNLLIVEDYKGEKVMLTLLQQFHLLAKQLNGALGYKEFMRLPLSDRYMLVKPEWEMLVKDKKAADRAAQIR